MGWGLWDTLLNPDKEELQNSEKTVVVQAANYLQVGEFQLLQLAYCDWYGEDLPIERASALFQMYMLDHQVPPWARHYARRIIRLAQLRQLDENDIRYHCYDHEFKAKEPDGVRKFVVAVVCLVVFVGGSIMLADLTTRRAASLFPPYFEDQNPARPTTPVP